VPTCPLAGDATDDDDTMCISLFSYGRPVVVRCKGVRLGMGLIGSWVHKFTWQWVGSVIWWVGLGWVDENRPTDNSETDIQTDNQTRDDGKDRAYARHSVVRVKLRVVTRIGEGLVF